MALCLSPQQRQNCLRLRNAHLHKVRDIMQDRYRINDMMQSTLPSYDFELQAARQHLRALQVCQQTVCAHCRARRLLSLHIAGGTVC